MVKELWYEPGKSLGWSKTDSMATRRRKALKSRRGNYLKTARALLALSNVTQDSTTARLAKADANYFFRMHSKSKK